MWHEDTLASLRAVLEGEDLPANGFDSDDDPQVLLNKRVRVRQPPAGSTILRQVCRVHTVCVVLHLRRKHSRAAAMCGRIFTSNRGTESTMRS